MLVTALLVLSVPAVAHHESAAYETTEIMVKGTVTNFLFINPHVQAYFDVKNAKGETEHWQSELTAPNKLAPAGWTKHRLNVGDTMSAARRGRV